MKILVTGSSGMLGTDLVDVLSPHFQVYGISRRQPFSASAPAAQPASSHLASESKTQPATSISLDLTEKEKLRQIILEIKPDVVIHAAAFTKVDDCEGDGRKTAIKQNIDVVKNLIDICNEANSFLMFFGTDYVFSGDKPEPYLETDPSEPKSVYGWTKAEAEAALKAKSNRFIIFRITWLYGKNGQHFPNAIIRQAHEKQVIPVVCDQRGRPTWTKDIALALKDLLLTRFDSLNRYNKQIFHLGNSGTATWAEFAQKILELMQLTSVSVTPISWKVLGRKARRPENSVLSLEKAKKDLGIVLRPWQEAIAEFLKN